MGKGFIFKSVITY